MYLGGGTSAWVMAFRAMMGRFSSPRPAADAAPALGVEPALHGQPELLGAGQGVWATACSVWALMVSGLG